MKHARAESTALVLLLSLVLLVGAYWVLRYAGLSIEGDATRLTQAADGTRQVGRLVHSESYSNAFGYPALLAFTADVTGLQVQTLQIAGSLWLAVVALVAYLAYREFLQ